MHALNDGINILKPMFCTTETQVTKNQIPYDFFNIFAHIKPIMAIFQSCQKYKNTKIHKFQ